MKKMFLAALTAMALCSYSYAQDEYEDEYEDEAPAKVEKKAKYVEEEEEDEAPAKSTKKVEKKDEKKNSGDQPSFGIGIDVGGMLENDQNMRLAFRLNKHMEISALLGIWHHGATTTKTKATGDENTDTDNYTNLAVGAGFDYIMFTPYIPLALGGEFLFSMPRSFGDGDDAFVANNDISITEIRFNVLAGGSAELIKGLTLNGKVGLGIDYWSVDTPSKESSYMDIGFVTKIYLTWFVL